jgi:SAM-dependent methyltransferase
MASTNDPDLMDSSSSQPHDARRSTPAVAPPGSAQLGFLVTSLLVATLAVSWFAWGAAREPGYVSDFDQLWHAARTALSGGDPYAAPPIGTRLPGFPPPMALYYPLSAVVIASPLAALSLEAARLVWLGAGVFAFTFLLLQRYGYERLPAVMSGAFLSAVSLAQWSPWLACAVMAPAFAWIFSGKPNVGLAAAVSSRLSARAVALAAVPAVAAFMWRPDWVSGWREAVSTAEHFQPYVLRPGGLLLLLTLLRWRRPEARWLAVIACVPGTPGAAEALVLFAFPMTFRQCLTLALLTHAPNFLMLGARFHTFAEFADRGALYMLGFVYLPVLMAVLRRANEGSVPLWVERLARPWPDWLRGTATPS